MYAISFNCKQTKCNADGEGFIFVSTKCNGTISGKIMFYEAFSWWISST